MYVLPTFSFKIGNIFAQNVYPAAFSTPEMEFPHLSIVKASFVLQENLFTWPTRLWPSLFVWHLLFPNNGSIIFAKISDRPENKYCIDIFFCSGVNFHRIGHKMTLSFSVKETWHFSIFVYHFVAYEKICLTFKFC